MATLKLDLVFRQSCLGEITISYLEPKTWNNLAAEIKLPRCVNTFKHDIKKLFFDLLKSKMTTYFSTVRLKIPFGFFHFLFFHFPFLICSFYPPRDHNENKVYLYLYYVIPATASLKCRVFLDPSDFISCNLY